jgi:hypothetical protein
LGKAFFGLMLAIAVPAAAQAPPQKASAEDPVQIWASSSSEWRAFVAGPETERVCYVTHASSVMAAQIRRETRPALYVTHRPGRAAYDVVSFVAGYRFRPDSLARMSFAGGPTYRLFTSDDFAWAVDEADDHKIVKALAESAFVTVTGLAQDGHLYTDTLALRGFPTVFQHISTECRRPGPPVRR